MNRFSRINTIWRKELLDTLRDRRTLVAMVLVPLALYPALMLGSLQAVEVQFSQLVTEEYHVGVLDDATNIWLRRLLDTDQVRREAEAASKPASQQAPAMPKSAITTVKRGEQTPEYKIFLVRDLNEVVTSGAVSIGLTLEGPPPSNDAVGTTVVTILYDESDIRSKIAADGLRGALERDNAARLRMRLRKYQLSTEFVQPLDVRDQNVASADRMAGAALGQVVPLILIVMTITGAIYPAIDLTAGERERGTLETLMVAPVPTMDLITGKFIVVTLIGMLSATLNLLSVGGTIYLGGIGSVLMRGAGGAFPMHALPWVLLLLIPLAIMFSAMLLAVCSFARSFKEAQNYIVPVMMAALIPGVVGVLPGTRFEGPIVIMPVANIVVVTRDLFLGKVDYGAIVWVGLTTSLYAGAAVAIAAKLFGQEAVLFADSGSIMSIFQRRYFKVRTAPSSAQALLLVTIIYSLNFYLQQAIGATEWGQSWLYLVGAAVVVTLLLGVAPILCAIYMRVRIQPAFRLNPAPPLAWIAALLFGFSTWILAQKWVELQQYFLPFDKQMIEQLSQSMSWMNSTPAIVLVLFMALAPAIVEELFFRGFVLSGLRGALGKTASVAIVATAFGLFHYSAHRMIQTTMLGIIFGVLVLQFGSIWPAILAHFMHNALSVTFSRADGLAPLLSRIGYPTDGVSAPSNAWVFGAAAMTVVGLMICFSARQTQRKPAAIPT